jgi:hypothetical protein
MSIRTSRSSTGELIVDVYFDADFWKGVLYAFVCIGGGITATYLFYIMMVLCCIE